MIHRFFKFVFAMCLCTAIYYYLQWTSLDVETQQRLLRVVRLMPVIFASLMATYTIYLVGFILVGLGSAIWPAGLITRKSKPESVKHSLLVTPQKGSHT